MEAAQSSSQDKTRFTTKQYRNHPEEPTEQYLERSLYPRTDRRNHFFTMRLVGSPEEVQEGWLGSHGWQMKFWGHISVARGFPLRSMGLNPKLGS